MGLKNARGRARRAWQFLTQDVWDIELSSLSALRSVGVRFLRVVYLVFKGFREDECPLHASALTFSSLMSIVPILALSLALARGLGDEQTAKHRIQETIREWTQTFEQIPAASAGVTEATEDATAAETAETELNLANKIDEIVESGFDKVGNVSFRALGGVGLVILLWMVIQVLGGVEASFNRVWGVSVGRSLWRKFTDYLSMLFILPLLVVAASSYTVADLATRFVRDPDQLVILQGFLNSAFLKYLTVLGMTTLTFMFIITFMPNATVRLGSAFVGGIVGAMLFLLWLKVCAALQVGAARYGKIYGSFAVVPIILAWVHVSWQTVLFGAETAFAVQNCGTYRMEQGAQHASARSRVLLAVSVVMEAARSMASGSGGVDVSEFARERRVPVRFLNDIIGILTEGRLIAELSDHRGEFVLLRCADQCRVQEVVDCVLASGAAPDRLGLSRLDPAVHECCDKLESDPASMKTVTVRELLAQPEDAAAV